MKHSSATLDLAYSGLIAEGLQDRCAVTASRVMRRCDQLALCSEQPGQLTRTFCTPAMADAQQLLRGWMTSLGMSTRLDPVANLIGRYHGPATAEQSSKVLLIGSHLDTVVNGGRFDGQLGVLLGLGLIELLHQSPVPLPFSIDIIGFCEEEGIRYRTPFIGSRAIAGTFDSQLLELVDDCGVKMQSAIDMLRHSAGDCAETVIYKAEKVIGYVEPHIEQGPVLEIENLPVGVVNSIIGQTRAMVRFVGKAGHAGTVPMPSRQDALAAAAEWIGQVESLARQTTGAVATVGKMTVLPNVANVIPSEISLSLDVRHHQDAIREALVREIYKSAEAIACRRRLGFSIDCQEHIPAVEMDPALSARLAMAIGECGVRTYSLSSGAGHDAAIMAAAFPTSMLFLRCLAGVSHHPEESVRSEDVAIALEVLVRMVHNLAVEHDQK